MKYLILLIFMISCSKFSDKEFLKLEAEFQSLKGKYDYVKGENKYLRDEIAKLKDEMKIEKSLVQNNEKVLSILLERHPRIFLKPTIDSQFVDGDGLDIGEIFYTRRKVPAYDKGEDRFYYEYFKNKDDNLPEGWLLADDVYRVNSVNYEFYQEGTGFINAGEVLIGDNTPNANDKASYGKARHKLIEIMNHNFYNFELKGKRNE